MSGGALSGVCVLELGQLIAGPFCGQLMGDMGAEVIKVEPPGAGDPMRAWGRGEHKLWWEVIARNKKSVSANLRVPEGQAIVRELARQVDVLIENFKPGTLERWGLAPAQLHELNAGLVIVRISGYGQTGPYAPRPGFGGVAEAIGGLRHIVGHPDRPPARVGISIGDTLAASYACMGALAALHVRAKTGRGQVVDTALYESVLQVMESLIPEYALSGEVRTRTGSVLPGVAPSNVYACSDGELVIAANKDEPFARMARAMGMPELADSPRFATHVARGRHQTELDAIISEWTSTRAVAEVERAMIDADVPAGRIYRAAEMLSDPHFSAREAIIELMTERWGSIKMQGCCPRLSLTPSAVRSPAPLTVGQHNVEIYGRRLGLSAAELSAFAALGVI